MIEIPVFQNNSADFTQDIILEGIVIGIRIVFNIRNEHFHITLSVENEIIYGLKMVTNFPLLFQHKAQMSKISGDFIILNADETSAELTYNNLGSSWKLYYITDSELDTWKIENGF